MEGVQRFGRVAGFPSLLFQKAVNVIARNTAEPGTEFGRFTQVPQLLPGGNERLLRQIFALAEAAGGAVGQRTNQGLIARYDTGKGIAVARQASGDQIGIQNTSTVHRFCFHHITA